MNIGQAPNVGLGKKLCPEGRPSDKTDLSKSPKDCPWQIFHPDGKSTVAPEQFTSRKNAIAWFAYITGHTWKQLYRTGYRAKQV